MTGTKGVDIGGGLRSIVCSDSMGIFDGLAIGSKVILSGAESKVGFVVGLLEG